MRDPRFSTSISKRDPYPSFPREGAITAADRASLSIGGTAQFQNNTAENDGGTSRPTFWRESRCCDASRFTRGSRVWKHLRGLTRFRSGTFRRCVENHKLTGSILASRTLHVEGAIYTFGTTLKLEGPTFTSNTAEYGSGGGVYCSSSIASFDGSLFTANTAVWGGGWHSHDFAAWIACSASLKPGTNTSSIRTM